MLKGVVVDKDYGSVSLENLKEIQVKYADIGIQLAMEHFTTPEEIIAGCQEADVILGTGNPPLTAEVFAQLPNLKVVQRFGIGVNSIDLEAATNHQVFILNMPGFCAEELSVHATALIMSLIRNVSFYDRNIRQGKWLKTQGPVPRSPRDLTIGLYGFGESAHYLYDIFSKGFGSRVITSDPYLNESVQKKYNVTNVAFEELLKESDIISIHAPLNTETKHIFNRHAFKLMKKDSAIINVARGGLINETDLITALKLGEIGFAGLDVFNEEPLSNSPLKEMDNVVLTPHSAFYGEKAQEAQLRLAVSLVDSILNRHEIGSRYVANKNILKQTHSVMIK